MYEESINVESINVVSINVVKIIYEYTLKHFNWFHWRCLFE